MTPARCKQACPTLISFQPQPKWLPGCQPKTAVMDAYNCKLQGHSAALPAGNIYSWSPFLTKLTTSDPHEKEGKGRKGKETTPRNDKKCMMAQDHQSCRQESQSRRVSACEKLASSSQMKLAGLTGSWNPEKLKISDLLLSPDEAENPVHRTVVKGRSFNCCRFSTSHIPHGSKGGGPPSVFQIFGTSVRLSGFWVGPWYTTCWWEFKKTRAFFSFPTAVTAVTTCLVL